jgi:replication factor C subunit 3/5
MSTLDRYAPWIEKHRPKTLSDLASQTKVAQVLQSLASLNCVPHLIFHGPPGTGKTSAAHAFARMILKHPLQKAGPMSATSTMSTMMLELNASDNNGIDTVRNIVEPFVRTHGPNCTSGANVANTLKLVVLDEADNMSAEAQDALRHLLEKYTATAKFCFICNTLYKITPAIRSRCTQLRFAPLKGPDIAAHLQKIARLEKCTLTAQGLDAVLQTCGGDMRKAINTLQACNSSSVTDSIDHESVYACTGKPKPETIQVRISSFSVPHAGLCFDDKFVSRKFIVCVCVCCCARHCCV